VNPKTAQRIDKSQSTVEKTIKKLREDEILERVGSTKAGYWKINLLANMKISWLSGLNRDLLQSQIGCFCDRPVNSGWIFWVFYLNYKSVPSKYCVKHHKNRPS